MTTVPAVRFEQANKSAKGSQFLPIVAKPKQAARGKKPEPKLTRVAFKVSRLMEFCSERELQNQTGHSIYDWPLVVGKEIADNALDACEEAEVAPDITVIVDSGTIIIQDNAGGISSETVKSILDYTIRVSSREAYLRWDDAIRIVLDAAQLDEVRAAKQRARKKAGDFTERDEDEAVDDQD